MALTTRLSLTGPDTEDPEDLFGGSLGVIFAGEDVTNQHGDAEHGLLYTSPHLPRPFQLALAEINEESDRHLFSHYLWNSSLLLAELIEAGTLGLPSWDKDCGDECKEVARPPVSVFDVKGLSTIELGAGTALPSIMAGLLGARRVVVTDYPSPPVLKTLRDNVKGAVRGKFAPSGRFNVKEVVVEGHKWGELEGEEATPLPRENKHAFDRVFAADCLWMPWQHDNLRRSVAWFLGEGEDARAWVVAAFHTGRGNMAPFFDKEALETVGLEVEHICERDCDGQEREWARDRGIEDVTARKRWHAIGILRRIRRSAGDGGEESQ